MDTEKIQAAIKRLGDFVFKMELTGSLSAITPDIKTALACMEKQVAKPLHKTYPYGKANEPETECPVCGNPYADDSYCSYGKRKEAEHD